MNNSKNYIFLILTFIVFTSCQQKKGKIVTGENSKLTKYESYFNEVKSILDEDNGSFWGRNLHGPILVVDRNSRVFLANQNNLKNKFKKIGNLYQDTLPENINIANTAVDWEGIRWTMVIDPLPDNIHDRNNIIIHELFHRVQPQLDFDSLKQLNTDHLDTRKSRELLKLELEALKKALSDVTNANHHVRNALIFRVSRHESEAIKLAENSLEINEGICEYTAVMLSGVDKEELVNHFNQSINRLYSEHSFLRSFAYECVPIYGYLLSLTDQNWHKEISRKTILTDFFIDKFGIEIPKEIDDYVQQARSNYGYDLINQIEIAREKEIEEKITLYKTKFIDSPTLSIQFNNMNMSFDYRIVTPLENYGTVYPNIRVTDDWGILNVTNGALLWSDWSKIVVSKPTEITSKMAKGDGWELELNAGWSVVDEKGFFQLKKD